MAYQQKEGQGSLFKNEKQNDRQPDFKGTLMIKGVLYEVAGWQRTSQNGRQYISLQAAEPDPNRQSAGSRPQQGGYQQQGGGYGYRQQSAASVSNNNGYYPYDNSNAAPAPTMDDLPADGPVEDLPF